MRIYPCKDEEIFIRRASSNRGVPAAVRKRQNPIATVLKLNSAFVDMLFPAIRGIGIATPTLLTRAGRGNVRHTDSIESNGATHIAATGLVTDRYGTWLLNALTVSIDTHANAIGGRVCSCIQTLQRNLATHEMSRPSKPE